MTKNLFVLALIATIAHASVRNEKGSSGASNAAADEATTNTGLTKAEEKASVRMRAEVENEIESLFEPEDELDEGLVQGYWWNHDDELPTYECTATSASATSSDFATIW